MITWKQVDEKDAHFVAAGSLRLGTFRNYAELENGRDDRLDGAVEWMLHNPNFDDPKQRERMRVFGVSPSPESRNVIIQNNTWVQPSLPMYVYCMTEEGCRHDDKPDVTKAIFEVSDAHLLARMMLERFPDKLKSYEIRRVSYGARSFDAVRSDVWPPPSPWIKRRKFAGEREIRLVFEPARPLGTDPRVPLDPFDTPADAEIAKLLRRVS